MSEDNGNQMSLDDFRAEVQAQEYAATFGSGIPETLKNERQAILGLHCSGTNRFVF